jgi:hypothetical protein
VISEAGARRPISISKGYICNQLPISEGPKKPEHDGTLKCLKNLHF